MSSPSLDSIRQEEEEVEEKGECCPIYRVLNRSEGGRVMPCNAIHPPPHSLSLKRETEIYVEALNDFNS